MPPFNPLSKEELQVLSDQLYFIKKDNQHQRAHAFGKVQYLHPQRFAQGVYLPADLGDKVKQIIIHNGIFGGPFADNHERTYSKSERQIIGEVVKLMLDGESFSGGRDYGLRFITGDVGEIRNITLDGKKREVLVIPQGLRRAEATAASFQQACMVNHPLSGKAKEILEVMVKTMAASELKESIYFRLTAGGDATTHGANAIPTINALVQASTWEFTAQTPYKLTLPQKVLQEVEDPLAETPHAQLKGSWRYFNRVLTLLETLHPNEENNSDEAKKKNVSDVLYAVPNGLFVDTTYTNLIYVGKHPHKSGWTLFAFPEISLGNYFFQGKTQATLFELIQQFGEQQQMEAVRVSRPEQLAVAYGFQHDAHFSLGGGRALTRKVVLDCVDGLLGPGTFLGPQIFQGIKLGKNNFKKFTYEGEVGQAVNSLITLYNDTVWALHRGGPAGDETLDGRTLSANPRYCTLFDMEEVKNDKIKPLRFRSVENE